LKNPDALLVPVQPGATTTALVYEAQENRVGAALVLGHGAGAGQRSTFIVEFARALSAAGLDLVTFNFLYTEQHRHAPDRAPLLEGCYRAVIEAVQREVATAARSLFVGGKSMGGRIATQVAASNPALNVRGLVLLGYPLHPPGRPETRRDAHLPAVGRPMLFVQGSRDTFGTPDELRPVVERLSPIAELHVVERGDHSFKLSGKDSGKQALVYREVQQTIVAWVRRHA